MVWFCQLVRNDFVVASRLSLTGGQIINGGGNQRYCTMPWATRCAIGTFDSIPLLYSRIS